MKKLFLLCVVLVAITGMMMFSLFANADADEGDRVASRAASTRSSADESRQNRRPSRTNTDDIKKIVHQDR